MENIYVKYYNNSKSNFNVIVQKLLKNLNFTGPFCWGVKNLNQWHYFLTFNNFLNCQNYAIMMYAHYEHHLIYVQVKRVKNFQKVIKNSC